MKHKIGYLIIREELFSPIIKTQVIDLLKLVDKKKFEIVILWACRIDYLFKKKKELNDIESYLAKYNIRIIKIPILVLKFPLSKLQLKFLWFQLSTKMKAIMKTEKFDIIHARGYNAGFIAAKMEQDYNGLKAIFDARSPYLTEISSTYGVDKNKNKYKTWAVTEKYIIKNSAVSVATTKAFSQYFRKISNNIVVIPNNANINDKTTINALSKKQTRKSICYVGSIGYGWNDVRTYANFTKKINQLFPDILFEYYIRENNFDLVVNEFQRVGIPNRSYIIESLPQNRIQERIAGSLCGLQIMEKEDVRMGIKTVDYLSAGVPILCNSKAVGATEIVASYGVGVSFENEVDSKVVDFINTQLMVNQDMSKRCLNVAEKMFSSNVVSKKYEELYTTLINY